MNDQSSLSKAFSKSHVRILPFYFLKMIYVLLDHNSIICSSSVGQEIGLGWPNDFVEDMFNFVDNDLNVQLVHGIAQSFGTEVS